MIGQLHSCTSAGGIQIPIYEYIPQVSHEIDDKPRRRAVVIFPGGGYGFLSEREAEPIALMFASAGFNAYVALYRVAPNRFPVSLQDAAAAVAYVRKHSTEHFTDPSKIAVMGFSAGGHLAGSISTRWHVADYWRELGLSPDDVRPNASVLCYPVITGGEYAHRGSFCALTGSQDTSLHQQYSVDGLVTEQCPPTFLWHTFEDGAVPVQNSLLMAQALSKAGVLTELHIFPHGGHGSSLCSEQTSGVKNPHFVNPYNAQWINMAIHFLKENM